MAQKIFFSSILNATFLVLLITNILFVSRSTSRGVRSKKFFRYKFRFYVSGLADYKYLVWFSIWTFISRGVCQKFFRYKIKFYFSGLADHKYLVCFQIWTFISKWRGENFLQIQLIFRILEQPLFPGSAGTAQTPRHC